MRAHRSTLNAHAGAAQVLRCVQALALLALVAVACNPPQESAAPKDPPAAEPTLDTVDDAPAEALQLPPSSPLGPPGPFGLELEESEPASWGPFASSERLIALSYRSVLSDPGRCPEGSSRCFPWSLVLHRKLGEQDERPIDKNFGEQDERPIDKKSEGTESVTLPLISSETPSGVELSAVLPLEDGHVCVIWSEGFYTGDLPSITLQCFDAEQVALEPIELFPDDLQMPSAASVALHPPSNIQVCFSAARGEQNAAIDALGEQGIWCLQCGPKRAPTPPQLVLEGGAFRFPDLAWYGPRGLLTWVRNGEREAALVDSKWRVLRRYTLGPASARRAALTAAHGVFLLVWQNDVGRWFASPIDNRSEEVSEARHEPASVAGASDGSAHPDSAAVDGALTTLELPGLDFSRLNGVGIVPNGFLLVGERGGSRRMLHLDIERHSLSSVEAGEDAQALLLLSGYDALDFAASSETHTLHWRSTWTLLGSTQANDLEETAPAP
ncbi:MAG: hypothetical protein RBU37_02175 [Myxococcota bacterium]|nr:hypothetical protein [Myxococcota bacterium]